MWRPVRVSRRAATGKLAACDGPFKIKNKMLCIGRGGKKVVAVVVVAVVGSHICAELGGGGGRKENDLPF